MSTARHRRRKRVQKGGWSAEAKRSKDFKRTNSLRQRVTMEVARLASVLGMTLGARESNMGHDAWSFNDLLGSRVLDYWPLTGVFYASKKGHEPDVRKVLEMAARINNER